MQIMLRMIFVLYNRFRQIFVENLVAIFIASYIIIVPGCQSVDDVPYVAPKGILTDVDGNVYKTVLIGNQWWMQDNLKVTKYRNGVQIPNAKDDIEWVKPNAAYCLYENNSAAPGLLYNFYAVIDANNIAPYGWHVPTDNDWKQLEMYLGMNSTIADRINFRGVDEGDKLKFISGWQDNPAVHGNNESEFSALAGSCRLYDGLFGFPGLSTSGFWWTSTLHKGIPWFRYLDYKKSNIFRYYGSMNYGFSIRCVKD